MGLKSPQTYLAFLGTLFCAYQKQSWYINKPKEKVMEVRCNTYLFMFVSLELERIDCTCGATAFGAVQAAAVRRCCWVKCSSRSYSKASAVTGQLPGGGVYLFLHVTESAHVTPASLECLRIQGWDLILPIASHQVGRTVQ